MYKDFKTKHTESRLIIEKTFFGFGFLADFYPSIFSARKTICFIRIDFFFIRFWMDIYKK
jgi:hypothetical protein